MATFKKGKFHFNKTTGDIGKCTATKRQCYLGLNNGGHFDSESDAMQYMEEYLEAEAGGADTQALVAREWGEDADTQNTIPYVLPETANEKLKAEYPDPEQYLSVGNSATQKVEREDELGKAVEHAAKFRKFLSESPLAEGLTVSDKDSTKNEKKLNIHSFELEGELIYKHLFDKKQVHGVINYNNIDKDSYKSFGFNGVDNHHKKLTNAKDKYLEAREGQHFNDKMKYSQETIDATVMTNESEKELGVMNQDEKNAIYRFTGGDYEDINRAAYTGKAEFFKEHKEQPPIEHMREWANFPFENSEDINSPAYMKYTTDNLDSALSKGPSVQRTVYRGVNFDELEGGTISRNMDSGEQTTSGLLQNYVDTKYPLGQELVIDGYHSASSSAEVGVSFAGNGYTDGVVFEIKSAEGLNISANSEFDNECEVLLPRKARYMVVGRHKLSGKGDQPYDLQVIQMVAINDKGAIVDESNERKPESLKVENTEN